MAIGFFDGVHLGHQQIIRQTIGDAARHGALSMVMTFDRHPAMVVAPQRAPQLIYPLAKKLAVIESLGVDALYLVSFDRAFSETPGEPFVRNLCRDFARVQSICVGGKFVFGHQRSGSVDLLKRLATELGYTVHALANVSVGGQPVSSTRIREAVRAGDLDAAGQLLGRAYSLSGRVVEGAKVGRKIGSPTANLETTGLVLPPNGVYAARALARGQGFRAAVNIGVRPTMPSTAPAIQVEAHLLDFSGELYGESIELTLVERLREEMKFESVNALQDQIARDLAGVRGL